MEKFTIFLLIAVLSMAVVLTASADQEGNKRWCTSDPYGCWVTDEDGGQSYIMFWSEAARELFMGKDSTASVVPPMPGGEMTLDPAPADVSLSRRDLFIELLKQVLELIDKNSGGHEGQEEEWQNFVNESIEKELEHYDANMQYENWGMPIYWADNGYWVGDDLKGLVFVGDEIADDGYSIITINKGTSNERRFLSITNDDYFEIFNNVADTNGLAEGVIGYDENGNLVLIPLSDYGIVYPEEGDTFGFISGLTVGQTIIKNAQDFDEFYYNEELKYQKRLSSFIELANTWGDLAEQVLGPQNDRDAIINEVISYFESKDGNFTGYEILAEDGSIYNIQQMPWKYNLMIDPPLRPGRLLRNSRDFWEVYIEREIQNLNNQVLSLN
ncbi:MAG: hypothetical protein IKP86_09535 [Anaerolineaceae bacterium]|nr:hypothetical protein [Anaerolineaceae bacterium]